MAVRLTQISKGLLEFDEYSFNDYDTKVGATLFEKRYISVQLSDDFVYFIKVDVLVFSCKLDV